MPIKAHWCWLVRCDCCVIDIRSSARCCGGAIGSDLSGLSIAAVLVRAFEKGVD
ncbi:hypothetical protein D3C84_699270 [compost metagenome]